MDVWVVKAPPNYPGGTPIDVGKGPYYGAYMDKESALEFAKSYGKGCWIESERVMP